jgi:hypothetical protein
MTENDATPAAIAFDEETADDDLDVVAGEDEDLDDDSFDLDDGALALDDHVVVQQLEPPPVAVGDTDGGLAQGALADEDDLDADRDFDAPDADAAPEADDGAQLLEELGAMSSAALAPVASSEPDARLARVEAAARALAQAERERESGKVRRKVKASTTGAGAIGAIPILLQLTGALHLRPELAAAVSTAAAIVGSLAAGWATPERRPPAAVETAEALLDG